MEKGKIIFLNGVSSSGKTTLAKTLQERLTEPFFLLNPDTLVPAMLTLPDKFKSIYNDNDWFHLMLKSYSAFHRIINTISDIGLNTVVDTVLLDHLPFEGASQEPLKRLDECVELLHNYPVLFVHVTCPLEEIRRREKERGDRRIGHGESQLAVFVPKDTYDITVDTYNNSTEECADKIIELLNFPEKLTSFKTLWLQLAE